MDENQLVTVSKLAELYAVDRRTMKGRLKGIEPVKVRKDGRGESARYRLGDVMRLLPDEKDSTLTEERRRETKLRADLLELKLAEEKGELVRVDAMLGVVEESLSTIRNEGVQISVST